VLDKFDFYAKLSTKELLVVDRDRWRLTMYRLSAAQKLEQVGESRFGVETSPLVSSFFPIRFALIDDPRVLRVSDSDEKTIRDIAIGG
jgi:Uma2 family endonuclease